MNQVATIYDKPITEEGAEGRAFLIKRLFAVGEWEGRTLARWLVHFPGDARHVERNILEPATH